MIRTTFTGVLAGVLFCGLCSSQGSPPASDNVTRQQPAPAQPEASSQTNERAPIAPGSVIPAKLTKTVDARKAKTGDEVEATVTQDLKAISGDVVVPKDTQGGTSPAEAPSLEPRVVFHTYGLQSVFPGRARGTCS